MPGSEQEKRMKNADKIARRQQAKTELQTAPIEIQDIIVVPPEKAPKTGAGEFRRVPDLKTNQKRQIESDDDLVSRLTNHIQDLANVAKEKHLHKFFVYPEHFISDVKLEEKAIEKLYERYESTMRIADIYERYYALQMTAYDYLPEGQIAALALIPILKELNEFHSLELDEEMVKIVNRVRHYEPTQQEITLVIKKLTEKGANFRNPEEMTKRARLQLIANFVKQQIIHNKELVHRETEKLKAEAKMTSTLKPDKKNSITRLLTSEFSFYPHSLRKNGPLDQKAFAKLRNNIEKLAREYPPNLHLLLSSFPVKNSKGEVHNTVLYVECGPSVKIQTFVKAVPSSVDLEYPNTSNPYFLMGSSGTNLSKKIIEAADAISNNDLLLQNLYELCNSNQDYAFRYDPSHRRIGENLKLVEFNHAIYDIRELNKKNKHLVTDSMLDNLVNLAHDFAEDILKNYHYELDAAKAMRSGFFPVAGLSDAKEEGTGNYYGGYVESELEGGACLVTIIDLCMDKELGIGAERAKAMLRSRATTGFGTTSPKGAHIVTSRTIPLKNDHLTRFVAQADPYTYGIHNRTVPVDEKNTKVDRVKAFNNLVPLVSPKFGGPIDLLIYEPRPADVFIGEINNTLQEQNKRILELEKLRFLQRAEPENIELTNAIRQLFLELAVIQGDAQRAHALIVEGADCLKKDADGQSLLDLALATKQFQIIALIRKINPTAVEKLKMDFTATNSAGDTLLNHALYTHDFEFANCLLRKGADPTIPNAHGERSLAIALNAKPPYLPIIKELIKRDPQALLGLDLNGETALHICIRAGNIHLLPMFLSEGVDVNARNNNGETPLHLVALQTDLGPINFLLHNHAKANIANIYGDTPLTYSLKIAKTKWEILDALSRATPNYETRLDAGGNSLVHMAILARRTTDEIATLAQAWFDKNFPNRVPTYHKDLFYEAYFLFLIKYMHEVNNSGNTPLHEAVLANNLEIIQHLISLGADINAVNEAGDTPLHLAVKTSNEDLCTLLMRSNPDVTAINAEGLTPFHYAAINQNNKIISPFFNHTPPQELAILLHQLTERGTDLRQSEHNTHFKLFLFQDAVSKDDLEALHVIMKFLNPKDKDKNGNTPLSIVIDANNPQLIQEVLKLGADPDVSSQGNSPLTDSITRYNMNLLELFILAKADVNKRTKNGSTPIETAINAANILALKKLIESGADINLRDPSDKQTYLHLAIHQDKPQFVKMLIAAGADLHIKDKGDLTPLGLAINEKRWESIILLLANMKTIDVNDLKKLAIVRDEFTQKLSLYISGLSSDSEKLNFLNLLLDPKSPLCKAAREVHSDALFASKTDMAERTLQGLIEKYAQLLGKEDKPKTVSAKFRDPT